MPVRLPGSFCGAWFRPPGPGTSPVVFPFPSGETTFSGSPRFARDPLPWGATSRSRVWFRPDVPSPRSLRWRDVVWVDEELVTRPSHHREYHPRSQEEEKVM